MRFGILGPVHARLQDGTPIDLGGPKVRALLALLLADAGRVVPADRLIDGLYADAPPDGAANALQSQVSRLRKHLGATAVEFSPAGYRLAVAPEDVDVHRFTTLAEAGGRALRAGDPHGALRALTEALALWRGEALTDVPGAAPLAARLAELRLVALEDQAQARLATGEHRDLVPSLRELIEANPLRERLRILQVRTLAATGRQAEALVAFEDARRTLAEELGADPSEELARAHLDVLGGEPVDYAPLPAQLTSFVGREQDLARVGALLAEHRLVTLTGPGGTGKTRLAVEAACGQEQVCFVELAALYEGADIPQALLTALGVREDRNPVRRMIAVLAQNSVLLVLDNCEHLVAAVAALAARLLAACPRLRVLATSREPLGITGEALYAVPRLDAPEPGTDLLRAKDFPAVRLFIDRARAGRPDFALDEESVQQVIRVCAALDGLPLAIELAAARVRALPLRTLAERLDDRFSLLSKGSRTAAARHRTLRAVVEWSWDLLDAEERGLAAALSVFAGGATLAAAERVCGGAVLELITSLADKSLVEVSGEHYRMLETIRAFCAEQLGADTERVRRAHAECFLDLAETAEPHLLRAEQVRWLERLDADHDNLICALRWAMDADPVLALRLAGALAAYWHLRGRRAEGAQLGRDLLARLTGPPEGMVEEYVLCVLGAVGAAPEDLALREHVDRVDALTASWHSPHRRPILTVIWAMVSGPPDERPSLVNGQVAAVIGTDPWSQAVRAMGEGFGQLAHGSVDAGTASLTTSLARFRAIGERWGMTQALAELGPLASWRGEHDRAVELMDEAIALCGELGAVEETAEMLAKRAQCHLRAGHLDQARADCARSVELAHRMGSPEMLINAYSGLAELATAEDDPAQARRWLGVALEHCPTGGFAFDLARAHLLVGMTKVAEPEQVPHWLRQALADQTVHRDQRLLAGVAEALARLALARGDGLLAAQLLGAATGLRGTGIAGDPVADRIAARAVALLGVEAFTAARAEGLTMSQERVLALSALGA
ncbi:BTAD domain-containing putative transcriptional regulator [Kutzneria viridogrisea]|uniref:ATPase n=1 Tax=Kutzneria viridogrisea TaxID=47990 RepID=A0ABR6BHF2_9PSEU|nr:putative ATPase [Kutzneria viridogrisea]